MFIKKLRISNNYRRFHDLTIDLGETPKRIIALVGPNGCGKSAIFDAMIYHNRAYAAIGKYDGSVGQDYHFMSGSEQNDFRSIQIIFDDGHSFDDLIHERTKNNVGPLRLNNTVFSFRSPYRYNSSLDVKETRSVADIKENRTGASTTSDIDQKMEDNYRRLSAKYRDYMESADCKPSEARAHIIGELNEAIRECLSIEIVDLGNVEGGRGCLYFKKPDQQEPFSFNVLSSGEKSVVDMLLDLYLRKDIYNDSIFLLDEPELHINTAVQRKLLIEMCKMIGDNCQIWLATHSIGMLRALQGELKDQSDIIRFDGDKGWAKEAFTLTPMPKTRKNWQELFATALDDLTALLAPAQIIYCEGRDTPSSNGLERGFDAKVYNIIFGEEYHDTLFVSSGGNTELDQRSEIAIAIIGKALPETDILVLKDRDMASEASATESDRQEYLRLNPDNHRVLKRFELENYLFDKSVLLKFCASRNTTFDAAKYDALSFDIVNDDVKSRWNEIKNACGISVSIGQDKFKEELASYLTSDLPLYTELKGVIFDRQ